MRGTDASRFSDEVLEHVLRHAELAPKVAAETRERIFAAVTAPGRAAAHESLEHELERGALAPRVPRTRRAEILAGVLARGDSPWAPFRGRWNGFFRIGAWALPVAAAVAIVIVVVWPDRSPRRDAPYVGIKGAPPVAPRVYRASVRLAALHGEELRPLGELARDGPRLVVAKGADLALLYRNGEGRPLRAVAIFVQGDTARVLAGRAGPNRLSASAEEGYFELENGSTFVVDAPGVVVVVLRGDGDGDTEILSANIHVQQEP